MPTKNPRINVTLKPSTAAILARMSVLTKNSQSAIVGELLESSEPVFERVVRVLEAAQSAQASVNTTIKANLQAAERVLDKQLGLMLGDMEERSSDAVDSLEAIARRKGKGSNGGAQRPIATPPSNRGVANHPKRGKSKTYPARRKYAN